MELFVFDQVFGFLFIDYRNYRDEEEGKDIVDNGRKRGIMIVLFILIEIYFFLYQYIDVLVFCKQCLVMVLDLTDKEFEIKFYVKLVNIYYRFVQYIQVIFYNGKFFVVGRDF